MRRLIAPTLFALAALAGSTQAAVTVLDKVAVVVDESAILQSDIDKRLQDVRYQFSQRRAALPPEDLLRKQVVEQLIMESLQLAMAERGGIKVDDAALTASLADIAKQNKLSLAQFQEQLDNTPGSSYTEVREQVRREMLINRLRQRRMQDRIRITEQDVQNFLRSPQGQAELATEYRLAHILIGLPEPATPEQITAAQRKAEQLVKQLQQGADFAQQAAANSSAESALKGGDLGWRKAAQLPSLFTEPVANMAAGDIAGPLRTPGGFHIIKLLEKRGDEMLVTQYKVRHILIKPNEIRSSEEARQELQAVRDKLVAGASFADLAKIHSEDPGSARNGGELGWVMPGDMVPEFEKQMLEATPGQVSSVFQSPFGWHILEVEGQRRQDMSEQYRANMARQALYARQYDEELANWLRELRSEAFVDFKTQ